MKNSAVHAMISNQFPTVKPHDISVKFNIAIGNEYEYDVSLIDDDEYRKFNVKVTCTELENFKCY